MLSELGLTEQDIARRITEWVADGSALPRRLWRSPSKRTVPTQLIDPGRLHWLWQGEDVRILVVEDEKPLADAIVRGLRREGMAVDVAYDGDEGHEKASITRYDVIVLDRDLPGMSGDELCRQVVASGQLTRVIMLTASGTVEDRVAGLSLGADDYRPPFAFQVDRSGPRARSPFHARATTAAGGRPAGARLGPPNGASSVGRSS